MNEFEVRRALEVIRIARLNLIRNDLNNDELERRYTELVELLMTRLTLLEFESNGAKVNEIYYVDEI